MNISKWTPLHTRLISHRIGDGTVNVQGSPVWDNKHIKEFTELASLLGYKLNKTVIGDSYGTYKVPMPRCAFEEFGKIFNKDMKMLIRNSVYLLESISELPDDHKLQMILALITDDGCCKSWLMVVFEDQHKDVIEKVYDIWESLFPGTSNIKSHKTKRGTEVYHLFSNRRGIELLYHRIKEAEAKYGPLANLWWKQHDIERRYFKLNSDWGRTLESTQNNKKSWEDEILRIIKCEGQTTTKQIMQALELSFFRVNRVIVRMVREGRIVKNGAGSRTFYSLENDRRISERDVLLLDYVREHGSISNSAARKLLDRSMARIYIILKDMAKRGLLKQKGKYRKAVYAFP